MTQEQPSADELKQRIDDLSEQHDHGSSEGQADPATSGDDPTRTPPQGGYGTEGARDEDGTPREVDTADAVMPPGSLPGER